MEGSQGLTPDTTGRSSGSRVDEAPSSKRLTTAFRCLNCLNLMRVRAIHQAGTKRGRHDNLSLIFIAPSVLEP